MTGPIHVINPNSSVDVTERMEKALADLAAISPYPIRCHTLAEGPPGIETQAHVDGVTAPLIDLVDRLEADAAGYVIACFSDPGVHALRERTAKPVIGIAEAAVTAALSLGDRFGIIAIKRQSIARHLRFIATLGLGHRVAGDRAIDRGVTELADEAATFGRMVEVGHRLRDEDGADSLIMGCAGFAAYRQRLEEALDMPVLDPTPVAVGQMISRLVLDIRDGRQRARARET